ncbi:hypothetical protein SAMN05444008_12826 [Cnuella takakiae]|uniref:Uncharacterized protein n=1 Tax=Cnuella takakiae TaxID=1302690 RepID=A0A1M5J750_9BACT|nr:hypothetical protein SAMN05444008_12826 [Cnuella takakiae]
MGYETSKGRLFYKHSNALLQAAIPARTQKDKTGWIAVAEKQANLFLEMLKE